MTSLGSARRQAPRRQSPARWLGGLSRLRTRLDVGLGLAVGLALCLLTFETTGGATGGSDLAPNTWSQIVLVLIAAVIGCAALSVSARGRAWGAVSLTAFVALTAMILLSIAWSVQPDSSWLDGNLTLSYLAAFGVGIALARVAPERWAALIGALAVVALVVCGYALLGKVFPATIAPGQSTLGARLSAPYGYWNATGLLAALGLPPCVWWGARRDASPLVRALAVPAIGLLVTAVLLSYSRGALLAAVVGLACWFAFVPLRLRGALVLAIGVAGGGAAALWAIKTPGITSDGQPLASQVSAGHTFGVVLAVALGVSLLVGIAALRTAARRPLDERQRRRAGAALLALAACAPLAVAVAFAESSRGFTGQVSHVWSQLTGSNLAGGASHGAGRLLAAGNLHAAYWREGLDVGSHALFKGVGGLGFGVASQRYSKTQDVALHAHSFWIETFADLGLLGVAVTLALFVAWAIAAARAGGLRWGAWRPNAAEPVPERAAERAGLLTLLAVVVVFGVHSSIDWTWFIPGLTVPVLLAAGWLAGRGPLGEPVGRAASRKPGVALHRALAAAPGRFGAAAALVAIALVCAWTIWQPLRSSEADVAALAALSANHPAAALADARSAHSLDPLNIQPLLYESHIYQAAGDTAAAHRALTAEVALQPANPETWLDLGIFEGQVGQQAQAITALRHALRLAPYYNSAKDALQSCCHLAP